ncbi:MAG: hypothetical protein ACE37N_09225 [Pseudohongiellaceae bacterium]
MPDFRQFLFGIGQHFCIGSNGAFRVERDVEENHPPAAQPQFAAEPKYVRSFFVNAMKECAYLDPQTQQQTQPDTPTPRSCHCPQRQAVIMSDRVATEQLLNRNRNARKRLHYSAWALPLPGMRWLR